MVFFVVVAVTVAVVNRRVMLDRASAAISVLAPER
jgi:hypothetical protein